jgi:hypothetical protein
VQQVAKELGIASRACATTSEHAWAVDVAQSPIAKSEILRRERLRVRSGHRCPIRCREPGFGRPARDPMSQGRSPHWLTGAKR